MKIGYDVCDSPIGKIYVVVDEVGVRNVFLFEEDWNEYNKNKGIVIDSSLCRETILQLREYFSGERRKFDLALSIEGTEFRKRVWGALMDIPYGEIRSYMQIAEAIGNIKAVRAVGQANKSNNIPIIIPCHRVIGKSGNLVGFAGNRTPTQKLLLELEGVKIEG